MSPGKKKHRCYVSSILLLLFAHLWGITNKTSISYCLVSKFYPCLSFSQLVQNIHCRRIIPTGRPQESRWLCLLFIICISYWLYGIIFYKPVQHHRPILLLIMFTFILHIYNIFTQVRMQALKCFSVLAFENPQVSMTLVDGKYNAAGAYLTLIFLIGWIRITWSSLVVCSVGWWRIVTASFCEDVTKGQAYWNAAHVSQMVIFISN